MRTTRTRLTALVAMVVAITAITAGVVPMDARASHGGTHIRTRYYTLGSVGPWHDTLGQVSLGTVSCQFGSLCLGRTVGDYFTVRVTDDSGRKVGGIIGITGRDGWALSRSFCGVSARLPAVPGSLFVSLDAPGDVRGAHWHGGPGCAEIRPFGTSTGATTLGATSGRVQVTFTTDDR